jgi:hypothetical protein
VASAATETLRQVRIAAAIAHALTACRIELRGQGGRTVEVGFDGDALSPCALRHALVLSGSSEAALAHLVGLPPGPVEVHVAGGSPGSRHAGLGVYGFEDALGWGFLFATTLGAQQVAIVLEEALAAADPSALDDEPLHLLDDPALEVTVVFSAYPDLPQELFAGAAEALALRAAEACLVTELIDLAEG